MAVRRPALATARRPGLPSSALATPIDGLQRLHLQGRRRLPPPWPPLLLTASLTVLEGMTTALLRAQPSLSSAVINAVSASTQRMALHSRLLAFLSCRPLLLVSCHLLLPVPAWCGQPPLHRETHAGHQHSAGTTGAAGRNATKCIYETGTQAHSHCNRCALPVHIQRGPPLTLRQLRCCATASSASPCCCLTIASRLLRTFLACSTMLRCRPLGCAAAFSRSLWCRKSSMSSQYGKLSQFHHARAL